MIQGITYTAHSRTIPKFQGRELCEMCITPEIDSRTIPKFQGREL